MTEILPDAETTAALLLMDGLIRGTSDPRDLSSWLAAVGASILSRLGSRVTGPADVKIDIGTDEDPDVARITITWPLPPVVTAVGEGKLTTGLDPSTIVATPRGLLHVPLPVTAAKASEFPRDFAADTAVDDPGKPWRVIDASGNPTSFQKRKVAREHMYNTLGSVALYLCEADGRWWLQETLLRET